MKKIAFITGGTRGIGKALAIKMSLSGYKVIVTYVKSDVEAENLEKNYGISAIKVDAKNYDKTREAISSIVNEYGKIDVAVNNAAIAPLQKLLIDAPIEELDEVTAVNFKGVYNVCKAVIPHMLSGGGVVCNVSSVQGIRGGSCEAIYSATKAAVIGLTRALAEELRFSAVKIFAVAPTLTDTDMNARLSLEEKIDFIKESGLEKIPAAEEVAEKIYTLIAGGKDINGGVFEIY